MIFVFYEKCDVTVYVIINLTRRVCRQTKVGLYRYHFCDILWHA